MMNREEAIKVLEKEKAYMLGHGGDYQAQALSMAIKAIEQEPCEDCISRTNALRVAKNEYLRGWHEALCKALNEKYSIHCEEGNFSVIQEETITGLGLSMDCAVGKDVENYMSTIPSVTPTKCIATVKFSKEDMQELVDEKMKDIVVERKKGKWIVEVWNNKEHHTCSNCRHVIDYEPCYHYCPYCGAEMEGEE